MEITFEDFDIGDYEVTRKVRTRSSKYDEYLASALESLMKVYEKTGEFKLLKVKIDLGDDTSKSPEKTAASTRAALRTLIVNRQMPLMIIQKKVKDKETGEEKEVTILRLTEDLQAYKPRARTPSQKERKSRAKKADVASA